MPLGNRRAPGRRFRRWTTGALAAPLPAGAMTPVAPAAGAQEEMVVVATKTGARIRQPAASSASFSSYDATDLQSNAVKDIRDLAAILPAGAGAENNADNLTWNYTQGTANVNLRGLGVASTLVLLNGRRRTPSAVQTDDGSSFVDPAALVPVLALERVEALKDGASAIYGSEAVAGVVNFITRRDYEGARLELEYRGRTNNGSQDDINLDGVFGRRLGENASLLPAAAYLNRTKLVQSEVDWRRPSTSSLGNLPSFVINPGAAPQEVVPDPGCAANGGTRGPCARASPTAFSTTPPHHGRAHGAPLPGLRATGAAPAGRGAAVDGAGLRPQQLRDTHLAQFSGAELPHGAR